MQLICIKMKKKPIPLWCRLPSSGSHRKQKYQNLYTICKVKEMIQEQGSNSYKITFVKP